MFHFGLQVQPADAQLEQGLITHFPAITDMSVCNPSACFHVT
jgi:hypothetical protein